MDDRRETKMWRNVVILLPFLFLIYFCFLNLVDTLVTHKNAFHVQLITLFNEETLVDNAENLSWKSRDKQCFRYYGFFAVTLLFTIMEVMSNISRFKYDKGRMNKPVIKLSIGGHAPPNQMIIM